MSEGRTVVAQAPHGGAGPRPSSTFGKYTLVRKLADGGMAEIYLAKQVGAGGFERNVVIKRIHPHLSTHAEFVGMFLDEARLAARFSHPNVVQVSDAGLAEGSYYLCMEYLAGEDFSTVLRLAAKRGERVPIGVVARVLIEAANGLHYAHDFTDDAGRPMNVVHRDVSPSNVFITYQGPVKVLDFGIAKAEARATHTRSGTLKGKYLYMSPEQVKGEEIDRRADIFSLGIVLYEALTGTRPFARDSDAAVLSAVMRGDVKPLRQLRPDAPVDLENLLSRTLSVKRENRPPTAAALATELERMLSRLGMDTSQHEVGRYVRALFGEERIATRSRIPGLDKLLASGDVIRGFTDPETPVVHVGQPGEQVPIAERATDGFRQPPPGPVWLRTPLGIGLLALGVAVAGVGAGVLLSRRPDDAQAPSTPQHVAPQGVVTPSAPTAAPGQAPTPAPTPTPEAAQAASAPEPAPEPVKAPAPRPPPRRPSSPQRVAVLDESQIQKVVVREQAQVARCFERHKDELPGEEGKVRVRFTIAPTGKVSVAQTQGALAGTSVGSCLEKQVAALRFPASPEEVSLELPFAYRVAR